MDPFRNEANDSCFLVGVRGDSAVCNLLLVRALRVPVPLEIRGGPGGRQGGEGGPTYAHQHNALLITQNYSLLFTQNNPTRLFLPHTLVKGVSFLC